MSRYFDSTPGVEFDQSNKRERRRPNLIKAKKAEKISYDSPKDAFKGPTDVDTEKLQKYQRGEELDPEGIKTTFKRKEIIKIDEKIKQSVVQSVRAELLLPEESGFLEVDSDEDTYRIRQEDIVSSVDITSAAKSFSLSLTDFGPYTMNYSRDGRYLLLGGKRGHLAAMDWVTKKLLCETNVMESVHDICWLHNPTMFATAQKEWVYIYDTKATELHCLKQLSRVLKLEFLPYHFLLVTSSEKGFLCWLDISVGKMITETYTSAGRLGVLCQNPYNAVVLTGHANGTVSMWSPNVKEPLVKLFCNHSPVTALAVDGKGQYLATGNMDRTLKIWDIRTYKCLQQYKLASAPGSMSFSQNELLATGMGNVIEVYQNCCGQTAKAPYICHKVHSTIADLQFCPYEDVLGIGHHKGFSSILVPGSGEPNFDTFENNPFMTKTQRREMEVKSLLEKIQPELITLDPSHLGMINVPSLKEKIEQKKALLHVKTPDIEFEPRQKMKGKSKLAKRFQIKKAVTEQQRKEFVRELKRNNEESEKSKQITLQNTKKNVLDRFRSTN